jgi:CheY-like chemotaxis protein
MHSEKQQELTPNGEAIGDPSEMSARSDGALVRRCLLLVEDHADIRECFGALLEQEGFTVILAANGAEALARLDEMTTLPDFILLDLGMPVMDGFVFRAEQRADARIAHIPVVVISADPHLDARHDVLAAHAFLQKPCDIDRLVAMVSGRVGGAGPAGA